jgi:hypothetical protein
VQLDRINHLVSRKMADSTEVTQLPPLILHPFSGGGTPGDLMQGSRASLALQGLVASDEEESVLFHRMINGRYQETRMLLFLGKDIFRWMEHCVEHLTATQGADQRIVEQSFAALIVEDPPEAVRRKLESWGVNDRRSVFSRAIGIRSVFEEPPPLDVLSPIFLKNYHRYADHAYICYQHLKPFLPLKGQEFQFEIFASEEYARLLSDQWESS